MRTFVLSYRSACLPMLLCAALHCFASTCQGAPAAKTAKPAKPAVPHAGRQQMQGDNGTIGTIYTLGKLDQINFTLKSVEYTVAPVDLNGVVVPNAGQKLMILRYTIHNPQKQEHIYNSGEIDFKAVDAAGATYEYNGVVAREGTSQPAEISLVPAQKAEVFAVIPVLAKGELPKLIVRHHEGTSVVRYDLRGKVKALPSTCSDPADRSGASALATVTAAPGVFHRMGGLSVRLDSTAYSTAELAGNALEEGQRHLVLSLTLRNDSATDQEYSWGDLRATLVDVDGEKTAFADAMFKAKRDEDALGTLKPDGEAHTRIFCTIPAALSPKSVELREIKYVEESAARGYVFDVSAVQ